MGGEGCRRGYVDGLPPAAERPLPPLTEADCGELMWDDGSAVMGAIRVSAGLTG